MRTLSINMATFLCRKKIYTSACQYAGEVSRGRSSEEACRKAGGAKGRRTTERATKTGLCCTGKELSETRRERQLSAASPLGEREASGWIAASEAGADGKSVDARKEEARKCSMK